MKSTLLLIEDHDQIREGLLLALNERFDLVAVSSVDKGILMITELSQVDVLVTDLDLKDPQNRDGLDIAARFRSRHAKSPLVLITGQTLPAAQRGHLESDLTGILLQKPFEPDELLQLLERRVSA
jgi:DNA-binding NtrC family response regulator